MSHALFLALAALISAGAVLAVQAPVNAALARAAGDPTIAVAINFGVGFLVMSVVCILRGAWPIAGFPGTVPIWAWVGGALGGFYITMLVLAIPVTGALTAATAGILGQLVMSMILDHFGAFGLPVQPITWQRVAGLGLVLGGLLLSRA